MKVLILAAGHGTRLFPLIKDTPKALLKIQGKALLSYIVEKIKSLDNLNEILIITNGKFYPQFLSWKEDYQASTSVPIRIMDDGTKMLEERLGSMGDVRFALDNAPIKDDVLIVGSDNLFDQDIERFMILALKNSPLATIGAYDVQSKQEAKKFGVVSLDEYNKIISFEEKPVRPKSSLAAMCFYYFPKETLHWVGEYIQETRKTDAAGEYIKWLCSKTDVYGFKFSGKWYDIGSVESYKEAQSKFTSNPKSERT